jgi:hypothetical protein
VVVVEDVVVVEEVVLLVVVLVDVLVVVVGKIIGILQLLVFDVAIKAITPGDTSTSMPANKSAVFTTDGLTVPPAGIVDKVIVGPNPEPRGPFICTNTNILYIN